MTESLDPSGDQWEIRQLVERYANAADRADGEAAAALFADDGEFDVWLDPAGGSRTGCVATPRSPPRLAGSPPTAPHST
jgi:hypothetical protein